MLDSLNVLKRLVPTIYRDAVQPAAKELGRGLKRIMTTLNQVLEIVSAPVEFLYTALLKKT